MIDPQLFAAFVVAATILILIPGPIVALVVANSVAHGPRTGLATVAGVSVGNALLIAGGAAGLTAIIALLVPVFEWEHLDGDLPPRGGVNHAGLLPGRSTTSPAELLAGVSG
jgi:hypothetical protein